MARVLLIALFILSSLVAADRQYSHGVYVDNFITMLRHVQYSFGW